jgi:hypothetical protein
VRIRFGSMVALLLQLAVASIPAALILAIIGAPLAAVVAGLFTSLGI